MYELPEDIQRVMSAPYSPKLYTFDIETEISDEFPNLNIGFKNNYNPIPFKKFYNMYKFLDEIISFVKHYKDGLVYIAGIQE